MNSRIVAIDLGGTQIRAALSDSDAIFSKRAAVETNADGGADAVLSRMTNLISEIAAGEPIQSIGLGVPGPLDATRGLILSAPNLPGIINFPVRDRLTEKYRVPVVIGNDANLAALGEHRFGAGRGAADMVYMTISTGIGGGIIAANKLFVGARGLAGEVGHQTLEAHGARCNCGNIGCLEVLASGPAIARNARSALKTGRASKLSGIELLTAKEVVDAARDGDALALEILERAGFYIGLGIVNLIHTFDSQLFVLGGNVAIHAWDYLYPSMVAVLNKHAMPAMREGVRIIKAELGDDSGLKGAVALVVDSNL